MAVLGLVAGYVRFQGLDTETVKRTAGELIADEEIRAEVAASLVDELFTRIDVTAVLEQRLPSDQKGLAAPAAAGLREVSERAADRMLERPRVQALWVDTVTRTHRQLLNLLEDDTGPLSTEGGAVVLNLQPLVIQLGDRVAVVGDVAERLGPNAGRVEILEAKQLETAQDLTQLLKVLGMWLWLVPVAALGGRLVDRAWPPPLDPAVDRYRRDRGRALRARGAPPCRIVPDRRARALDIGAACGPRTRGTS